MRVDLRCLDSLPGSSDDELRYEVIVVENGSDDGSVAAFESRRDIHQLIPNVENRGYAAAVNQAFAASRGDLILLLNSDVHFRPGSLSALVRFLRARSDVGRGRSAVPESRWNGSAALLSTADVSDGVVELERALEATSTLQAVDSVVPDGG